MFAKFGSWDGRMRVTSEFWIAALVRRAFGAGGFAAVERRGAAEAGAIFVVARGRFGNVRLYAPAPQASYDAGPAGGRLFQLLPLAEGEDALRARIEREMRFDPDLWVVELEVDDALLGELVPLTKP